MIPEEVNFTPYIALLIIAVAVILLNLQFVY